MGEEKNEMGRTALVQAAVRKMPRVVESLLEHGACVDATDGVHHTALMYAYQRDDDVMAATLVKAGARLPRGVNLAILCRQRLPEMALAALKREDLNKDVLLSRPDLVSYPDERTALDCAYEYGLGQEIIDALTAAGDKRTPGRYYEGSPEHDSSKDFRSLLRARDFRIFCRTPCFVSVRAIVCGICGLGYRNVRSPEEDP